MTAAAPATVRLVHAAAAAAATSVAGAAAAADDADDVCFTCAAAAEILAILPWRHDAGKKHMPTTAVLEAVKLSNMTILFRHPMSPNVSKCRWHILQLQRERRVCGA